MHLCFEVNKQQTVITIVLLIDQMITMGGDLHLFSSKLGGLKTQPPTNSSIAQPQWKPYEAHSLQKKTNIRS